jgi:hypothetical protein
LILYLQTIVETSPRSRNGCGKMVTCSSHQWKDPIMITHKHFFHILRRFLLFISLFFLFLMQVRAREVFSWSVRLK